MTSIPDTVLDAALALPPEGRAVLAEKLLESLAEQDQIDIDKAWLAEAEKRLAELQRGEAKAIPAEEVMRTLKIRNKP
jgi:putative addiction module component (TIGR02574 family)